MHRIFGPFPDGRTAVAILIIRLLFGLTLVLHGLPKIQHPFTWMGSHATITAFPQSIAAIIEFGGGLALILGLLTRPACLGIICIMLFAIVFVHIRSGQPFVDTGGGPNYELAAHYVVIALALIVSGPGRWSLDSLLFGRSSKNNRGAQNN
jgi:putative oxidoreductase